MAKGSKDSRARSWFIVCPNIEANGVCGLNAEKIATMSEEALCQYVVDKWSTDKRSAACLYCISEAGMKHLHIVLCSTSAFTFSTVKKFLGEKAHIEETMGKKQQVEDYINKRGAFAEKGERIIAKAQQGELVGRQGNRSDLEVIRKAIDEGMTWKEVRRLNDKYFDNKMTTLIKNMYFDKRDRETPFKRDVRVHWLYGRSGSGKTGIMYELIEKYGEGNIYLVSDYQNPFDGYSGEPIIILDEFRGQLPYAVLLGMLEGYKKEIHCRYANVLGLWTDVYITTIKTPEEAYAKMIDKEEEKTDPISQLLGRITDVNYCYRVNRATGTKLDRNGNPAEFYRYQITGEEYRELTMRTYITATDEIERRALDDFLSRYAQAGDEIKAHAKVVRENPRTRELVFVSSGS